MSGSRLPRRTIRLRLTLLYGVVFLIAGAALLGITYLLVAHEFTANGSNFFVSAAQPNPGGGRNISVIVGHLGSVPAPNALTGPLPTTPGKLAAIANKQSNAALHQLLIDSAIALAVMTVIAIGLGWIVAGRVLAPLRTITAAAQDISVTSLHRRLSLRGPDDDLKNLGDCFDDLLGRLESAFDAQRQFVANGSHELRTPLTLERTLLEVALADPEPTVASLREACLKVREAGEHQERLIEALLTLLRSQRGLDRHQPIDLSATVAGVLAETPRPGLALSAQLDPAWTRGDPRLIERLIGNLVTNAVRHNVREGRIEVRTAAQPGWSILTVENTGSTVPPSELGRLFEPFQRLEQERRSDGDGLGLGLSIVQAIARAHDAGLRVHANAGGGLRIEVSFPAVVPARPEDEPAGVAAGDAGTSPRERETASAAALSRR